MARPRPPRWSAALLEAGGFDPTVINGGIINNYGTNARLGAGDWMVVEADESDGTFLKLPATIAIVTNMDPEHLDHYGSVEAMNRAYEEFVKNIPFYGFAALCIDHPVVQAMIPRLADRRIVTYGFSPQADVRAVDLDMAPSVRPSRVVISDRFRETEREIKGVQPADGRPAQCAEQPRCHRRRQRDGRRRRDAAQGPCRLRWREAPLHPDRRSGGVTVIDDYGHHPVEIAAVLKAARQATANAAPGKVIAVVQPHRYTRLQNLFEDFCTCFNDADHVIVADVYAAGEAPIEGVSGRGAGPGHARARPSPCRSSCRPQGSGRHGGAAGA